MFVRILASYGFVWLVGRVLGKRRRRALLDRAHAKNAKRLYRGFIRLRGVFIKVGQVLSVLGGFLPPEFIRELEGLQDQVEPQPFRAIVKAFRQDRGGPPSQFFDDFGEAPIAAASLGQVHRATLDGEPVAVKVLYPNIEAIIRIDLRVLRWVFKVWRRIVPVDNIESVFRQLEDVLSRETDYRLEAANLERLAANFASDPNICFPSVHHTLSSKRILVMSFEEGARIGAVDEFEDLGINRTDVARLLVTAFYKQLLIDGLYHADPHPGNFLVRPGPQLVFLDFGAVEPVTDQLKRGMILMLEGIIGRDDEKALEGIETMGFVAANGNRRLLETSVRHYFTKLVTLKIDDYSNIDVNDIVSKSEIRAIRGRLRELMKSVHYPEGYFYIERSLLLLFGLCAVLDPKVNALELGFPFAMQFVLNNTGSDQPQPASL